MKTRQKGFIAPLIFVIIAILVLGGGAYVYTQNKQENKFVSSTYDIVELGVKFSLPNTLAGLTYKVVKLPGDQAVNSVEFFSKQLEAAGCGPGTAPLGYLTYDNDNGGTIVGHARNSDLYYIRPDGRCKTDASLQNWQELENALKSLATNAR